MKRTSCKMKTILAALLAMMMLTIPVCAADTGDYGIAPCFNNVGFAAVTIDFDMNNVVYCGLSVNMYEHGSGVSGTMKLYNSAGSCLALWAISDYEKPIGTERTYQGVYGETYTVTFEGHAYSRNGTPSDWLELSVTDTCED